jgi:hypothetical protein
LYYGARGDQIEHGREIEVLVSAREDSQWAPARMPSAFVVARGAGALAARGPPAEQGGSALPPARPFPSPR